MPFTAYLPRDRAFALARGEELPEHAFGAALFADISGFTTLTDALARELGPHRGAEELTRHLNAVYDALIDRIHQHGGSVISFSGDAVTCWFDNADFAFSVLRSDSQSQDIQNATRTRQNAARQAVACGLALQEALRRVADIRTPGGQTITLALKVAVATGDVRRLLVGNSTHHRLDILAGALMVRLAAVEHQAQAGDLVVDQETAALLGTLLHVRDWREDTSAGTRVAVIAGLAGADVDLVGGTALAQTPTPSFEHARPLLLPAITERLERGFSDMPTELRPVVALFLRFATLDYDNDPAASAQLDAYIGWVQNVIARYGGTLLDLSIGDKGSYLYAAFGAPVAHENDPERALRAALDLQALPPALNFAGPPQIGIARGTMRTGAYGGGGRLAYGVLGDPVNVAARLMQAAPAGQILVQDAVDIAGADLFAWEGLPPLQVKGKPRPVAVFHLVAAHEQPVRSFFQGTLIGREAELERLFEAARPVLAGAFAGVCVVSGEAGVGKSRLVFALRQRMEARSPMTWAYCPSDDILRGSLRPFTAWLRDYFTQSAQHSEAENRARFDDGLDGLIADLNDKQLMTNGQTSASNTHHSERNTQHATLADELNRTRSFLGALLGLRFEGSLYEQLEPKLRFENTQLALTALIRAESLRQPLLLELEDAHRLDEDSHTLLTSLTRALDGYPVAIVCAARPDDEGRPFAPPLAEHTPVCTVDLGALSFEGTCMLATQVLHSALDDELAQFVYDRTGGNPFFAEQLLLDLRERRLLEGRRLPTSDGQSHSTDEARSTSVVFRSSLLTPRSSLIEVPHTLNSLLVARLDRLNEPVREVVQTAAVLGREWALPVLAAMRSGDDALPPKVRVAEDGRVWSPLSERDYLFRHVLLRDAAYGMQLQAQRRELHRRALDAIETEYAENLASQYAALAYHAREAEDRERERRYAKLAGEAAAARYANAEAISYLSRALELTPEEDLDGRWEVLLAQRQVYRVIDGLRDPVTANIAALAALAEVLNDNTRRIEVALWRCADARIRGLYQEAELIAQQGLALAVRSRADRLEGRFRCILGEVVFRLERYTEAEAFLQQSLVIARVLQNAEDEAVALRSLAEMVMRSGGDIQQGQTYAQACLTSERRRGNLLGQSRALLQLANSADDQGDYGAAQHYYEEGLQIVRTIGSQLEMANYMGNLGLCLSRQGHYNLAYRYCQEAARIFIFLGHPVDAAFDQLNISAICTHKGDYTSALAYAEQALETMDKSDYRRGKGFSLWGLGNALLGLERLDEAEAAFNTVVALKEDLSLAVLAIEAVAGLDFRVALARQYVKQALLYAEELVDYLDGGALNMMEEPLWVYLSCYQALHRGADPRAPVVLNEAYQLVQARAAKLPDEAARRMFLEHVPHHRELVWRRGGQRIVDVVTTTTGNITDGDASQNLTVCLRRLGLYLPSRLVRFRWASEIYEIVVSR